MEHLWSRAGANGGERLVNEVLARDLLLCECYDLLSSSRRNDDDTVVVCDDKIAGVHADGATLDGDSNRIDVDSPQRVFRADPGDEGRKAHLDEGKGVARVRVRHDPSCATVPRCCGEQLAPIATSTGRDDHDVAGL